MSSTAPTAPVKSASGELSRLAQDYWEMCLESEPIYATYLGDHRYNDRLADLSPEARTRELDRMKEFARRALALDPIALGESEQVTREILLRRVDETVAEDREKFHEWAIDQMSGPQVHFFEQINYHPFRNAKDVEDLASRFRAFPRYLDQYLGHLRSGLAGGLTAPKTVVERVLKQAEQAAAQTIEACPLHAAVAKIPAALPEADRARLAGLVRDGIGGHVLPALRKFHTFLRDEYLPKARTEIGLCALPRGRDAYAHRIRLHTTTEYSAEQLHEIGREELRRIGDEMLVVARRRGFTGDAQAFNAAVRNDPKNFAESREELLTGYRRIVKEAEALLPKYFKRLPKCPVEVKAIEEYREKDSVAAFYYPPSEDFSRPGVYYANTYAPTTRARFGMAALTLHEAVPGHHLQIALAMELKDLPAMRRHGHFTAYIEGWALYAERLSVEMGLYHDDLELFGMLTYQAWRATRLVVDTGIHHFGWSRDRAIDCFRKNVALSEAEIVNEVDRYIIWPGQALSYKVGQREIQSLRTMAEKTLGAKFRLPDFHDVVLRNGAIPLTTLRSIVEKWVGGEE